MLFSAYKKSLSSSSSSSAAAAATTTTTNSNIYSNNNNWRKQTSFIEELQGSLYEVFKRCLREVWHFIVVPPLIAKAKRLQYEQTRKQRNNSDNITTTNNLAHYGNNHPNESEDEDEFRINYKRATEEFIHRLLTELAGTMILTTMLGANLLEARLDLISSETAAFNNGLAIVFLIFPLGGVSGAHFNPVVTLSFTIRRAFPRVWFPFYALAQFVGSIGGGLLIRGLFGGQYASLGTNSVNSLTSTIADGFKWEIFLTFCLVFVILQTATKSAIIGSQAAIAVGATLIVTSLIGGSESSASMNPWRTLGPAIINNSPDDRHSLWVFIIGPFIGSLAAYVAVSFVQGLSRQTNEITSASGDALNDELDSTHRSGSKDFVI